MAKKMVTDRSADASLLSATTATFLREVSPALQSVLSPFVDDGQPMPDVTILPTLAERFVGHLNERLIAADQANIDAQAELVEPRQRRDAALSHASETVYRVRDFCRGLYGRKLTATIVPDDRRIPQRPKAFLHMGEHVVERLSDVERNLPAPTLLGVDVERVELSANFESDLEELSQSLVEVDLKRREAEITQAAKNEAMSEFNVIYAAAIRLLEALAILAGKSELASRVRPTRRRRSGGSDTDVAEPASDAGSSAESSDSAD